MPLPAAHFFAGAAAAALARPGTLDRPGGTTRQPWRIWLIGGMLGVLPDMDTGIGILLRRGNDFHGIYTHTLLAVVAVAALAWMLAGRRWALFAAAAYGSHLVLDLFEVRTRTSVAPGWPMTDRTLETVVPLLPTVPYDRGEGVMRAAFSLLDADVFPVLVAQTLPVALLFAVAVGVRAVLARRRKPDGDAMHEDEARIEVEKGRRRGSG